MNKKLTLWTVVGVIVAGAAGTLLFTSSANLNTYDHLTACLRDNGSVMFGASWCPHCADQKKLFER